MWIVFKPNILTQENFLIENICLCQLKYEEQGIWHKNTFILLDKKTIPDIFSKYYKKENIASGQVDCSLINGWLFKFMEN